MSNMFHPVFTDAGRIAAAEDNGQGLSTIITHVVMGTGQYAVRDDNGMPLSEGLEATALQNEQLRVPVYSGGSPNPGQLNLVAEVTKADDADPQFYISEVGFLDADGVLICIWSHQSQNLGYRGDLGSWFLSLGLAWVDLPSDQFTVQVQNAPMAEQSVRLAQLRGQVMEFVTQSGIEYQDTDSTALDRAMGQRISNIVESLDKSIRTPIAVTPANNASGVLLAPTLEGNEYFSADGYSHTATRFEIRDDTGTLVLDTGELVATISYEVPPNTLSVLKGYNWKFQYKGKLGETEVWSDWSASASFTTADTYVDTPSLLSPLNNSTDVSYQPTLITSAFNVTNGSDVHVASEYQIASDLNFTNILWQSGQITDLTQTEVPTPFAQGQVVYVRARHIGQVLGSSGWLPPSKITITTNNPPSIAGLVHTVPSQGVRGASYDVTFTGATDSDGEDSVLTYEVSSPSNITFSKTTGIAQGETVQATFADAADGTTALFSVRAKDLNLGLSEYVNASSTIIDTVIGQVGQPYQGGEIINAGKGLIFNNPGSVSVTLPNISEVEMHIIGGGGTYSGFTGGGGGGYAYAVRAVTGTLTVTVGDREQTSSVTGPGFAVSAERGYAPTGGNGVGGDLNHRGGSGASDNDSGFGAGSAADYNGNGPSGSPAGTGGVIGNDRLGYPLGGLGGNSNSGQQANGKDYGGGSAYGGNAASGVVVLIWS